MKIIALLPARLDSKRIKNKLLKNLEGIPLILHTISRVKLCKKISEIIVCTDSQKIKKVVESHNIKVMMTSKKHKNGTERICEVIQTLKADLFIDVHSDEAILNPKNLDALISFHTKNKNFDIVVPHKISKEHGGKNVVKILTNKNKKIIYFTRSQSPFDFTKKKPKYLHHLDVISFKKNALIKYKKLKIGKLEFYEGVELLRALEGNLNLGSFPIDTKTFSINTPSDFKRAKKFIKKDKIFNIYKSAKF